MLEGVDVSWVQGNYQPGGEAFVIINASRANVGLAVGSAYRRQVANARAAGKHVGHYFFNGNIDPVTCADFFVRNLSYQLGDSLWLDCESEGSTGTAAWTPGQAAAFNARVMSYGLPCPGTYLNRSLMDGYDWSPVVKQGAALWIAYYQASPPPIKWWPTWTVWQYTSVPMDLNRAQGVLTASSSAKPIVEDDDVQIYEVFAKQGDPSGTYFMSVNRAGYWAMSGQDWKDYQFWFKEHNIPVPAVTAVDNPSAFGPNLSQSAVLDAASVQAVVAAIKTAGTPVEALSEADVEAIAKAVNDDAAARLTS